MNNKMIGKRLQQLRTRNGMTQMELAAALGITYQQIQKYEYGTNGLSALRLYQICKLFSMSVDVFLTTGFVPHYIGMFIPADDIVSVRADFKKWLDEFGKDSRDLYK